MGFRFNQAKRLLVVAILICLPALLAAETKTKIIPETVTKMRDFKVIYNETEKVYIYTGQIMLRAKETPAAFSYAYLIDLNAGETIDQTQTDKEGFFKLKGLMKDYQIISSSRPISPKGMKAILKNYRSKNKKVEI